MKSNTTSPAGCRFWDELEGFLFDLDGCVYVENSPTEGARECIHLLRKQGKKIAFLTNNSSMTPPVIVQHLFSMGIYAEEREIITPIEFAGEFLLDRFGPSKVFHMGIPDTRPYIERFGHRFAEEIRDTCDVVLLSCDLSVSYRKLDIAVNFLQTGSTLVVTNKDPVRPGQNGELRVETGALLAAIVSCVSVEPILIGKPSPYLFHKALEELALPPERVLMIGDTPSTDIAGGQAMGMRTALVDPAGRYTLESTGADVILLNLRELGSLR